MEFTSDEARAHYDAVRDVLAGVVVGLDFDGTLSPIVEQPERAVIHPDAPAALAALAARVRAVVVITGRPARQVVELGGLENLADGLPAGARLAVMGQYGHERWDSESREFTSPEPPHELQAFRDELPGILEAEGAAEAWVEEKGLAVAVHTRRLHDARETFARLERALADAAERHGLALEPGRQVLEIRSPGTHKGLALREAFEHNHGAGVLFIGDDLGDLEAFQAARSLRDEGVPALLVCSGSDEEEALHELSDMVVPGPVGVLELLSRFAEDAQARRAG